VASLDTVKSMIMRFNNERCPEEGLKVISKQILIRQLQRSNNLKHTLLVGNETLCHNHLEESGHLGNKKSLLKNLSVYSMVIDKPLRDFIPLSFHIVDGIHDESF